MNPHEIISEYYESSTKLYEILVNHSEAVAKKALSMSARHRELKMDDQFIYEAALLHDIGVYKTKAPSIHCFGDYPYIAHGYLGASMLRELGYDSHALVCERHTGTGLSLAAIEKGKLPLPKRDMLPISLEEQLICFADKFYSKSNLNTEKTVEEARQSLEKFGEEGLIRFDKWCKMFL